MKKKKEGKDIEFVKTRKKGYILADNLIICFLPKGSPHCYECVELKQRNHITGLRTKSKVWSCQTNWKVRGIPWKVVSHRCRNTKSKYKHFSNSCITPELCLHWENAKEQIKTTAKK